ncbi:MAG: matrixin family metalloprotease [Leptolyngbya sp. BL-A-14]
MHWERVLRRFLDLVEQRLQTRLTKRTIAKFSWLAITIGTIALVLVTHPLPTRSDQSLPLPTASQGDEQSIAQKPAPDFPLQPHPLPSTLAQWSDPQAGDYFDQIEVVPVNYLVWTHFPLSVYIQPPTPTELASPFTAQRSQAWITAVSQAMQEWNRYLPLTRVDQSEGADIVVLRSAPPLQFEDSKVTNQGATTGQVLRERPTVRLGRARSAATTYKVSVKGSLKAPASKPTLALRCTIQLRPDQAAQYLQAAARHELGHALGIWGHSRSQTDVMYFSQVRNPPPISPRDVNTLKRIYEQPTRLGWALSE